jgi:hypothetical protein
MSARDRAIAASRARRAAELAPLRAEVVQAIDRVGWRRARPVVAQVLGVRPSGLHGGWWAKVGKRSGARLLLALSLVEPEPCQLTLSYPLPTLGEGR